MTSPLSKQKVLQAAIKLADAGGIESLSMRKLAQELGVKAMSLYNHVANKEDILDGIIEIIIGKIELPDLNTNWKTAMLKRATSARKVLLAHPWATMAIVSRINIGPVMLRYIDSTLGSLHQAGFSIEMADHTWNAIDSYTYGFILQELNFPIQNDQYSDTAEQYLSLIPASKYPSLNKLTHRIIDGKYNGLHDFEFGLKLLLEGLDNIRINNPEPGTR